MTRLEACEPSIWAGRPSENQLYIYQRVKMESGFRPDAKLIQYGLFGFQCDEGVRRNLGRPGALEGPTAIRRAMGSQADHLPTNTELIDFGNVVCDDGDLETAHRLVTQRVKGLLGQGIRPILLGGGHDLAYAHFNAIKSFIGDRRVGIINLDAHLDLRTVEGLRSSGTPFFQISEEQDDFRYLCLGVQHAANHRDLFYRAQNLHVMMMSSEEFWMGNWERIEQSLVSFAMDLDHLYLTIDLDGFSSAYAPGVSAPSPMGFSPDVVVQVIHWLKKSQKLISVDIVELNPRYDRDGQTARLASRLIHTIISP